MESLAGDLDSLDENDPKQGAQLMRRLFSATGMPIQGGMAEALKRMEAGEDPEKIEEEMGDVLEQDPFGGLLGGEGGPRRDPDAGKKGLGAPAPHAAADARHGAVRDVGRSSSARHARVRRSSALRAGP